MAKFEELKIVAFMLRFRKWDHHPELLQVSEMQTSRSILGFILYKVAKVSEQLLTLMQHVPMAVHWRDDNEFLERVFDINFVVAEDLKHD